MVQIQYLANFIYYKLYEKDENKNKKGMVHYIFSRRCCGYFHQNLSNLQAAIFQLNSVKAFHADDGEEVVDEEEDDDGWRQPRDEDDGRAEHVSEALLHSEESQKSEKVN